MHSSQPQPVTLLKPERPSPHLNLAIYPPTVWTPRPSTLPPPLSSAAPAWRWVACQWWREQLLEARKKWEARWKSWCLNISEEKRETALSVARTHAEASVPFTAPTPKHARLMGTAISNVESCSTSVSVPPPPSSPPCPTSSVTYSQPWRKLVRQVEGPTPMMQPHRPQKWQQCKDEEWKKITEDRCKVRKGEGTGGGRGRGGKQG